MRGNRRSAVDAWRLRLQDLRSRGYGGWTIRPHRAISRIPFGRRDMAVVLLLPLAVNLAQLLLLDETAALWRLILDFWNVRLDLGGVAGDHAFDVGRYRIWLPQLELAGSPPDAAQWWWTLTVCIAILAATFYVPPERLLPGTYIVRACLAVQGSALAFFYVMPGAFPYDLESYIGTNLFSGMILMFLIPWLLALTFYIFDFSLLKKVSLTALVLAFFCVLLPMQYLFHAFLLHHLSMLFMPLLYIVFGMFADVLLLIAFYSWGMRWRMR